MSRTIVALGFAICALPCRVAGAEVDPRFTRFAVLKRQQTEELAAKLRLDVPPEGREFFQAAEAGDWTVVSNCFARICQPGADGIVLPSFTNILYYPVLETRGACEQFQSWDGGLLTKFSDGVLRSLPAGSIYFGGAGPGNYIIPAIRDVADSPDIFIIPQSATVDSVQMNYLHVLYGNRIWLPSEAETQRAFSQYVEESRTGQVRRVSGAMGITDTLTKLIFDNNKAQHEFFIEDSFAIAWLQPYLEPHGLILKLNKEPLAQLDPAVVAQDRQFWDTLSKELLADRRFTDGEPARNTYAKLRQIIGGLYAYRGMNNEAEVAFKQALEFGPTTVGPAWRLAGFYCGAARFEDALAVLQQFHTRLSPGDPDRQHTIELIAHVRGLKRQSEEKQPK